MNDKFCIWDEVGKRMIPWREIRTWKRTIEDVWTEPNYTRLWYTGLTDKEGTEIYEGDVVEDDYIAISEDRSQVYFQNGAFWVNYGGAVKLLADRDMRHIKVIGNKFEDPELLNDNE